ncbi:MAG: hypothetical protein H7099_10095 [Gemmatimonadaceae bacterium]|nr:hypothetical protein [Gemmatimonadaceae bacterium]
MMDARRCPTARVLQPKPFIDVVCSTIGPERMTEPDEVLQQAGLYDGSVQIEGAAPSLTDTPYESGTVLLSVPHILVARDLLASGVADGFVARGWKVVTISPTEESRKLLASEFASSPMVHECIRPDLGAAARLHMKLMDMEFSALGTLSKYMALVRAPDVTHTLLRLMFPIRRGPTSRRSRVIGLLERLLQRRADRIYAQLFAEHNPDLVLVPSPGFRHEDQTLLRAANGLQVPTLAVVSSWDNLTGRGAMKVQPQEFCVWNAPMVSHALRYHRVDPSRVHITGAAQFDTYARTADMYSRAEVEEQLGVAPGRVIITYLTAAGFHDAERHDLTAFIDAMRQRTVLFQHNAILVIRVHPHENARLYHQFVDGHSVILDPNLPNEIVSHVEPQAGPRSPAMARELWKASLLSAADVVFASCATTALIESCIFDRPSFLITPVNRPGVDAAMQSLAREQLAYTHQIEAQEIGAISRPRDIDALMAGMAYALDHPEHLREERSRLVERMCYRIDGQASARILNVALRCAKRV